MKPNELLIFCKISFVCVLQGVLKQNWELIKLPYSKQVNFVHFTEISYCWNE
jgi:hypothetical protein